MCWMSSQNKTCYNLGGSKAWWNAFETQSWIGERKVHAKQWKWPWHFTWRAEVPVWERSMLNYLLFLYWAHILVILCNNGTQSINQPTNQPTNNNKYRMWKISWRKLKNGWSLEKGILLELSLCLEFILNNKVVVLIPLLRGVVLSRLKHTMFRCQLRVQIQLLSLPQVNETNFFFSCVIAIVGHTLIFIAILKLSLISFFLFFFVFQLFHVSCFCF